jgi:hypothetical protein
VDWESQEGPGWEAFTEAYNAGFEDGCQALFDESPDGSLFEDDNEYSVIDCQNLSPGDATGASDLPQEVPQDPQSAGTELGELDGCRSLFEEEGVFSLNWGEESITGDDCPVGAYVAPTRKPKRKTKTVGSTCESQAADASGATIRVDKGEINCAGASALWREFLRRAPSEGAGSSGYLELEGWACFGSLATDVKKDGGCERTDHSASITVLKQQ